MELRESLDKLRDRSRDGVIYYLGEDGEPRMRAIKSPTAKPSGAAEYWKVLKLSPADALRFAKDIDDCLKAYGHRYSDGLETYLVHFALTPRRMRATRKINVDKRSRRADHGGRHRSRR